MDPGSSNRGMRKSKLAETSEDGVDSISNLPDPILHFILSLIPTTEEVSRTSILSRRWRYLWTSVPYIDIDYYRGQKAPHEFTRDNFKKFVCWVLANQSIDLESFRLSCGDNYSMSTMKGWIDGAVRRNVKLLDLKLCPHEFDIMELPRSLVTCGSLEVLRLSLSGRSPILPKFKAFSALRVLELKTCMFLNENSVKDFLKSCPLLEDLSLVNCSTYHFDVLCISCPKLKKLRIDNGNICDGSKHVYMCRCLEICCPKLEYLELVGRVAHDQLIFESLDSLKKAVINPEDNGKVCELFSGISHVESLSLYFTEQYINLEDLPKSLPNLKTLELNTPDDVFNMNALIRILICSPNIESLHLIFKEDVWYLSSPTEVPSVDFPSGHIFERLKMVTMTGVITGAVHEIGFIKFLLESSPVLETMTINPSMNMMTDEKLSFLTDDVLKFPRASPEAGITFVQD